MPRRRASASTPRSEACTAPAIGAPRARGRASRRRSARARRGRRREWTARAPARARRQCLGGLHHTVVQRFSSIAWMFASGVEVVARPGDEPSRRASNSRSRLAAISLNEAAASSSSAGPVFGARTVRSPSASAARRRGRRRWSSRSSGRATIRRVRPLRRRRPRPRGSSCRRPCETSPSRTAAPPRAAGRRRVQRARRSVDERWAARRRATASRSPTPSVAAATTTAFQITARAWLTPQTVWRCTGRRVVLDLLARRSDYNRAGVQAAS